MATHQIAQGIAKLGRHGDSVLVHMQPQEVAGLQALAKAHGTSMTVNPHTGLPEAFSLGGFFSSLLPVFAGGLTGGMGAPLWAGIAAGAATGAATSKNPLTGALMGGLGGYSGFGLGSGLANMGAANVAANPEGFANAAAINASNAAGPTAIGNSIADGSALINQGVNPAIQQGITQAGGNVADPLTKDWMQSASENLARSGQNLKDVATMQPGAWDSFKQGLAGVDKAPLTDMQAGLKLATPLGGAVLGGLEPSDLYGTPKTYDTSSQKYDPLRTLNLGSNTGLRLLASGGPVSFANGGNTADTANTAQTAMSAATAAPLAVQISSAPAAAHKKYMLDDNTFGGKVFGTTGILDQLQKDGKLSEMLTSDPGLAAFMGLKPVEEPKYFYTGTGGNESSGLNLAGLGSLNVDKNETQYADGGYVSNDDMTPPVLSQDGYGLGRLNAMSQGGMAGYAVGGPIAATRPSNLQMNSMGNGMAVSNPFNRATGQPALGPISTAMPNPVGRLPMGVQNAMNQITLMPSAPQLPLNQRPIAQAALAAKQPMAPTPALGQPALGPISTPQTTFLTPQQNADMIAKYGVPSYAKGGYLDGPGDGMSDSIPATIEGKQPARLADGEFVIPADVVSHLGNGSTKAGSDRLYGMLDRVRKARTGTVKQGKKINPNKLMPA